MTPVEKPPVETPPVEKPGAGPVHAVAMAFGVLEALACRTEPQSVTALAAALNTNKPKVHRHLRTLMALGYVWQDSAGGRYALTPKLSTLAQSAPPPVEFLAAARDVLPVIRDKLHLTVTVGRAGPAGVEIIDILRANTALQITTQLGAIFPLHSSAHGQVSLAYGPDDLLRAALADPTAPAELVLNQKRIATRRAGWAVAPGAVLSGINALAVPVLDSDGALLGSIAVLGAFESVPPDPPQELIDILKQAAAVIAARLKHATPENT